MRLSLRPEILTDYLRMGIRSHREKVFVQFSFWLAAIATGVAAVYFSKLIDLIQTGYAQFFSAHPYVMTVVTPLAFLAAVAVVKLFAETAGGSGVPQVLHATNLSATSYEETIASGLVSARTAIVKVVSTVLGFAGGASIGGEGPTVQIAGSIFGTMGKYVKKSVPRLDFHSYLVAAAGAGIATAFNTPLGGIAFALEEFAVGDFGGLRHLVLLAVIISGLTCQALVGDKLYFGKMGFIQSEPRLILYAVIIGVSGGVFGGVFGRIVASERIYRLKAPWWMRALACGLIVAVIDLAFNGQTAGSGYSLMRPFMEGQSVDVPIVFPVAKLLATAVSTLSGMGGGILAPSLTIGGWMGVSIAKLAAVPNLYMFALLGMVAYFTGAFQLPLTATLVVMEMTGRHDTIFPMMITALAAFIVARLIMPETLYHILIARSFEKK